MACHTWQGGGGGSTGGGVDGTCTGESQDPGVVVGRLEWICGNPTGGGMDWFTRRLAIRSTWLRRGAFARQWWPLVVPAVHAQLDGVREGGLGRAGDSTPRKVPALLLLPSVGGALPTVLPSRPSPWMAAALSAGYLPCIERLLPVCLAGADDESARLARIGMLQQVKVCVPWTSLPELLAYGEERQAAALLLTLVKAATEEVVTHVADESPMNGGRMNGGCSEGTCTTEMFARSFLQAMLAVVRRAGTEARAAAEEAERNGGDGGSGGGSRGSGGSGSDSGGGGAGGGGDPHDPNRQLVRLLSFTISPLLSTCILGCKTIGCIGEHQQQGQDADATIPYSSTIPTAKELTHSLLRLAHVARGDAVARDDFRAESSWLQLIEDLTGGPAPSGGIGSPSGEEVALSELLLPPCDADQVLLVCGNRVAWCSRGQARQDGYWCNAMGGVAAWWLTAARRVRRSIGRRGT